MAGGSLKLVSAGTRGTTQQVTLKVNKKKPKKVSSKFETKVKKALVNLSEKKEMTYDILSFTPNTTIRLVTDIIPIGPFILKGSTGGNNTRIGDMIQPVSLRIKGIIELKQFTGLGDTATRVMVRLMIIENRAIRTYDNNPTNPNTDWLDNLIDYGSGQTYLDSTLGMSNPSLLRSMFLPLNREVAIVHYDKLHYLNIPKVVNTLGTQQNNISFEKTIKMFDIKIKTPPKFMYSDDSNNPINFGPYLAAIAFPLNGDANSTPLIDISAITRLVFNDY